MKQDYEKVRAQLVERGYLGGALGRFIFTDWLDPGRRRPASVARAALKAALLGAPLLAGLLGVTVARASRPLLGPADLPLLWLYFLPIAALFLFVLDACVAWLNAALARRLGTRGGEGTRAALIAGLPTLIYLAVSMRRQPGADSFLYEVAFFLLALATVVTVSWLAGLVSVADLLARTGTVVGHRGRSLRTVAAFVAVVLLGVLAVRFWGPADEAPGAVPPFDVQPAPPLVVVGVDGLDGRWIETLAPTGAVDGLLAWMETGTVVPLVREEPLSPPAAWTSIVTGVGSDLHGVRAIDAERLPGVATPIERTGRALPLVETLRLLWPTRRVPVSGAVRRIHTAWEIQGLRRSTLAVGWWGSWPAEPPAGGGAWVVSDRVLPKLIEDAAWDRDTWPRPLFDALGEGFDDLVERTRGSLEALPVGGLEADQGDLLWDSLLIDAFALHTVETFWQRGEFESAFVYLPGLDILRHRLEDPSAAVPMLARARLLEAYTGWLDARLQELASATGPQATLALVADPGRAGGADAEGFLVVHGSLAASGCIEAPASPRSVAGVLLKLAGFPRSEEMAAYRAGDCLQGALGAIPAISSYGRRDVASWEAGSEYDPEMLERLKSLGYLN